VAARAAAAEPRTETDEEARDDCDAEAPRRRLADRRRGDRVKQEAAADETCEEGEPPPRLAASRSEETAGDAADARNAAVEEKEQGAREADGDPAEQGEQEWMHDYFRDEN
jgi:hypothetical protein